MLTGLTPSTYTKLQLNAGLFLKDFNYASITDSTALKTAIASAITGGTGVIGATRGGGTLTCEPELREVEADGKRSAFKGGQINDGWTVKMTGTMLEVTPENFKLALLSADSVTSGKITTLTVRNDIATTDYINHLIWVGDLSDGKTVLIDLENALNIKGASFTFEDKGEGTIPFEFQAHQASAVNQTTAPFKVVFFDLPTTVVNNESP